jgi:hypothetical protein
VVWPDRLLDPWVASRRKKPCVQPQRRFGNVWKLRDVGSGSACKPGELLGLLQLFGGIHRGQRFSGARFGFRKQVA